MAIKSTYLPNSDADKVIWLNNFASKIGTYAANVGLTPLEVTGINNDKAFFQYIVNMTDAHKQSLNNLTAYKNMLKKAVGQQHIGAVPTAPTLPAPPPVVPEGIFDRISRYVQRIKASSNYTDNIGEDLGIIAPETIIDVDNLIPELKVKLSAGRPQIKCTKGVADAIDLYVDRNTGNGFQLIGRLLKADYIDTENLPAGVALAEWEYKARFVIGNDNVGLMSPVASVIVKQQ